MKVMNLPGDFGDVNPAMLVSATKDDARKIIVIRLLGPHVLEVVYPTPAALNTAWTAITSAIAGA